MSLNFISYFDCKKSVNYEYLRFCDKLKRSPNAISFLFIMSNLRKFSSDSKTPFGIGGFVEIGPVIFIDLARDLTIGYLVHF